jgi:hypothetical protein
VFNATFNNIPVISWRSVLLVEVTTQLPQVTDKLDHTMKYRVHLAWARFKLTTWVVIGTNCVGSCNTTTIRSRPRRHQITKINITKINLDLNISKINPHITKIFVYECFDCPKERGRKIWHWHGFFWLCVSLFYYCLLQYSNHQMLKYTILSSSEKSFFFYIHSGVLYDL